MALRPSPIPASRVAPWRRIRTDWRAARRWALVVVLAAATGLLTGRLLAQARETRNQWGASRDVLVTTVAVEAGDPLAPSVTVQRWPDALAPDGALANPSQLTAGVRAPIDLGAGTPLTPPLAAARSGERGTTVRVAVPRGDDPLTLAVGDLVDAWELAGDTVMAPLVDPTARTPPPPRRVVRAAEVVAVRGRTLELEVGAAQVAGLVGALQAGGVILTTAP